VRRTTRLKENHEGKGDFGKCERKKMKKCWAIERRKDLGTEKGNIKLPAKKGYAGGGER